ncbi:hypothetical protein BH10PSE18_BH10PSE18_18430 [soil metagenome]
MNLPLPLQKNRRLQAVVLTLSLTVLAACTTTPLPPMPPLRPMTPIETPPPQPTPSSLPAAPSGVVVQPLAQRPPGMSSQLFVAPARGPRLARFDGDKNKGVDFSGSPGEPVAASRAGRVVLVSSALPGYGTMIVVKHDDEFISAYAQIATALVKEGDEVQQGQRIADMGPGANGRTELHFEIRRQGTAVDPEPYIDGRVR